MDNLNNSNKPFNNNQNNNLNNNTGKGTNFPNNKFNNNKPFRPFNNNNKFNNMTNIKNTNQLPPKNINNISTEPKIDKPNNIINQPEKIINQPENKINNLNNKFNNRFNNNNRQFNNKFNNNRSFDSLNNKFNNNSNPFKDRFRKDQNNKNNKKFSKVNRKDNNSQKNINKKDFSYSRKSKYNRFSNFPRRQFIRWGNKNLMSVSRFDKKRKIIKMSHNKYNFFKIKNAFFNFKLRSKRKTAYGKLLHEKQKLRFYYSNLKEHQFKKLLMNYKKKEFKFLQILESRLDVVLFRMNFVTSIYQSRQLINHGHVLINNQKITSPGHILSKYDIIKIKGLKKPILKKPLSYSPRHIEVQPTTKSGVFLGSPKIINYPFKFKLKYITRLYH